MKNNSIIFWVNAKSYTQSQMYIQTRKQTDGQTDRQTECLKCSVLANDDALWLYSLGYEWCPGLLAAHQKLQNAPLHWTLPAPLLLPSP